MAIAISRMAAGHQRSGRGVAAGAVSADCESGSVVVPATIKSPWVWRLAQEFMEQAKPSSCCDNPEFSGNVLVHDEFPAAFRLYLASEIGDSCINESFSIS